MFLDIGVGIITALIVGCFFQMEISLGLLTFSVAAALLPDADFIYYYFKSKDRKRDHEHRDYIHYPLIYLPIGTAIIFFWLGWFWAIIFFIASLAHFIHDSIGIGWGVKWLFPFNRNNYAFFYLASMIGRGNRRHLVFAFTEKELPGIVDKYGDPNWVKNIYFNWSRYAQIEFSVFAISILALLLVYFC